MAKNLSRREFAKRSAALVACLFLLPYLIPSSALGLGGNNPSNDRTVIGAIGTGSQGMSNMLDFLKHKGAIRFVAVCDVEIRHLAEARDLLDKAYMNKDCRGCRDFREFLYKEKPDAVLIALPDHWNGIIFFAAANKKKNIYGEEPICRTIKDGQTIINAIIGKIIIWQTGSWQPSLANFHRVAELAITTAQTVKWDPDKEEIIGNERASRFLGRPYCQPWTLTAA